MWTRPIHRGGHQSIRWSSTYALLLAGALACKDAANTTAPRPIQLNDARAVISKEGSYVHFRLNQRQHIRAPRFGSPRDSSWRSPGPGRSGAASYSLGTVPSAAAASTATYPDTAIVVARETGRVDVGSSSFDVMATLNASVLQGSWYPMNRASDGYDATLYVLGQGSPIGRKEWCVPPALWDVPLEPCMSDLSHADIYGFGTSTGTDIQVSRECGYRVVLGASGRVAFYHNFDRDLNARERREILVTDTKSGEIRRKCLPSPQELCEDPSYCSSTGDGGQSTAMGSSMGASVDGEVEFEPLAESGGFQNVLVCDVTDWYVWNGYDYVYTNTSYTACWWERR